MLFPLFILRLSCYNRPRCLRGAAFSSPAGVRRAAKNIQKEIVPDMPLVIVTVFFIVLFTCEGFWHLACLAEQDRQLRRYQAVEHPRRRTSDGYLDWLG